MLLIPTNDGGNYDISNNDIALDDSLYSEIFISLFGGNIEASTQREIDTNENSADWWGNVYSINAPVNQFNSDFERALINLPMASGNLRKFEQFAQSDLQWMIDKKIAKSIVATATIIAIGQLKIAFEIDGDNRFAIIWDATKKVIERVSNE